MPPITDISQLDLTKTYTYADYLTWQLDEFVELVKGKVHRMSPAPKVVHQRISSRLVGRIYSYLIPHSCEVFHAPFDVRLTRSTPNGDAAITTVVQPDICVICDPAKLDERGCLGAPDWIIEILSPKTVAYDMREKLELYEENGVLEYWIVLPGEKSIITYVLEHGRYQSRGTYFEPGDIAVHTLPELRLLWEQVFEGV
jgi:Uma2 family endonuclease